MGQIWMTSSDEEVMYMDKKGREEGIEGNENRTTAPVWKAEDESTSASYHPFPSHDLAEIGNWICWTALGDGNEGDVLTSAPGLIGLDHYKEKLILKRNRKPALNRRRPVEDDGFAKPGYHDFVDMVREFLDGN